MTDGVRDVLILVAGVLVIACTGVIGLILLLLIVAAVYGAFFGGIGFAVYWAFLTPCNLFGLSS